MVGFLVRGLLVRGFMLRVLVDFMNVRRGLLVTRVVGTGARVGVRLWLGWEDDF